MESDELLTKLRALGAQVDGYLEQIRVEDQAAGEDSTWQERVERLTRENTALKEQLAVVRKALG